MNTQKATYSAVLGFVLSNLRKQSGKEQNEIAEKMGLTQASYSRLESGKSAFSIDQMYQAASALGISGIEIIEEVERYSSNLQTGGINVVPQVRRNTTQEAKKNNNGNQATSFVTGAALGALLVAILSKK